jgi:hypothetical protein
MTGREIIYHKKCGLPASEVEIGGLLTKAKAILCKRHKRQADRQAFISSNGYTSGKISAKAKKEGYHQSCMDGTGVLTLDSSDSD